jgi:hypothetical protein
MSIKNKTLIVRTRMKQTGITAKQLAHHIMQPEELVLGWLSGKNKLLYRYVWAICDILELNPVEILKSTKKSI